MPKDSKKPGRPKSGSKKGKPSPFKGKAGTKTARIKQRAQQIAAQKQQDEAHIPVGPVSNIMVYGSDDVHVHKISRGLYTDELLPLVEELAGQGLTNDEMATSLGIGNRTFYDWRDRYPQFAMAIAKYRGVVTSMVENAFINNCLGYSYTEQQLAGNGMVRAVEKWHPGETKAQALYMFNHMGHRYKHKVETQHQPGKGMEAITFSLVPREE